MPLKGGSKMTNYILSFGAGLAVGIGATYIYMKQKYEEKLSEQIQEVRKHYQKKENVEGEPDRNPPKTNKPKTVELEHYQDIVKRYSEVENELAERESPQEDEPEEDIYEISAEEADGYLGYDEISLTYYQEDDILCDDQEEVIEKPEDIIGNALDHFSEDLDTIYVINRRIQAVFEVQMVEGSYAEYVLGDFTKGVEKNGR